MEENDALKVSAGVVRRQWWVVVLAVAAAVVVGLALSRSEGPTYEGTQTMTIDYPNISRYEGIPVPDDMIARADAAALREEVAKQAGVPLAAVAAGLKVSSEGNPQNRLVITFSGADKATAAEIPRAAAVALAAYASARAGEEVAAQQRLVVNAESSIAAIERSAGDLTQWQKADNEFKKWTMRKDAIEAANTIALVTTIYRAEGETKVKPRSGAAGAQGQVIAFALVGLIAGVAVGAARELLARRGSA